MSLGPPPAAKSFDHNSLYPTLGIDFTLPQHRLINNDSPVRPLQDEYPVWYFFYGTLADPESLSTKLGIAEDEIELHPAQVYGGALGRWAGRYLALVDGEAQQSVAGYGYLVRSEEDEAKLRAYETNAYEVVRCRMEMEDRVVPACTVRFLRRDAVRVVSV